MEFVKPYQIASLIERRLTPAFDVLLYSHYMENAHVFMWKDIIVCCWPELCILQVDYKCFHYVGYIFELDLAAGEYRIDWYLRGMFGMTEVKNPSFDMRYIDYALGYCKMKSFNYEPKSEL